MGHEGVHAVFVLDNGTALFTGIARRGEDGDASKHRRTPKPTRPKKILKVVYLLFLSKEMQRGFTMIPVTRECSKEHIA